MIYGVYYNCHLRIQNDSRICTEFSQDFLDENCQKKNFDLDLPVPTRSTQDFLQAQFQAMLYVLDEKTERRSTVFLPHLF